MAYLHNSRILKKELKKKNPTKYKQYLYMKKKNMNESLRIYF